ncbi:hypothetical protein KFL_002140020 [Klebsormidium nitens]|uniref:Fluoride ion transporter CrcB n=1 Tax=Klebsormidium nitens TaxID=105231 RepID=A0A1Y1IA23_KLENI|nr:hypothetical protein KFL_002140020 [Klebsormidium nitens]|eukprot:GAQ84948.1 hypothetical protein KFL_002140020 [Klebsormidium nitens]
MPGVPAECNEELDEGELELEELEGEEAGIVPEEEAQLPERAKRRRWVQCSDLVFTFSHLALASVIGVLIRCGLEDLFGSRVLGIVGDQTALFTDLPVNMVGSFFMGVIAFAWKDSILRRSNALFLSLTAGMLGSLTTYSGFNQSITTLFVEGNWAAALLGLLIGVELPVVSLVVGIDFGRGASWAFSRLLQPRPSISLSRITADEQSPTEPKTASQKSFRQLPAGASNAGTRPENRVVAPEIRTTPSKLCERPPKTEPLNPQRVSDKTRLRRAAAAAALWLGVVLPLAAVGAKFDTGSSRRREIWLAAALAPPGVWLRYLLSRFNVRPKGGLKWLPVGTLLANVIASAGMAGLSVVLVSVRGLATRLWCQGVEIGVMGALSTVSTFAAEIYLLDQGKQHVWRSYVYILVSLLASQTVALLIYGVPVWIMHYD